MKKLNLTFIYLFFLSIICSGQFGTGLLLNRDSISKMPKKLDLSIRSFQSMPASFSLEKYCPIPGNQAKYGTCTAWSNAYGVNTILYAKTHDITDKAVITKYAFSPTFIYEVIKNEGDNNCQGGSHPITALEVMKLVGVPFLSTVPYACGTEITDGVVEYSKPYAIKGYSVLFAAKGWSTNDAYYKEFSVAVDEVKKALTEGSPVSGAFKIPQNFNSDADGVWRPIDGWQDDTKWKHGLHAMTIVGYDDNKDGGAFRILNSWGTAWGDKGFIWMRYSDFKASGQLAIQVFANPNTPVPPEKEQPKPEPKPEPKPQPAPKPAENTFELKGDVEFKLNTGDDMPIKKTTTRNLTVENDEPVAKEDLVAYTMRETYSSGTKFRFYLNVDKEAYIYAFASDLTGKVNLILPFADNVSTLVGGNSVIAFPSDTKVIKMDENKGRDYLLILYSATALDAKEMAAKMNTMKGALSDKIKSVLGGKLIDKSKIEYATDKVGFSTKKLSTRNLTVADDDKPTITGGSVVPLMIEIKHN